MGLTAVCAEFGGHRAIGGRGTGGQGIARLPPDLLLNKIKTLEVSKTWMARKGARAPRKKNNNEHIQRRQRTPQPMVRHYNTQRPSSTTEEPTPLLHEGASAGNRRKVAARPKHSANANGVVHPLTKKLRP